VGWGDGNGVFDVFTTDIGRMDGWMGGHGQRAYVGLSMALDGLGFLVRGQNRDGTWIVS
jgi:hypothetical protein